MSTWRSVTLLSAGLIQLGIAPAAWAHEHDTFKIGDRQYIITIGSLNEPIMVDKVSGVDFRVAQVRAGHAGQTDAGTPVAGLDQTLKVELSAGNKKRTLSFDPARNTPGAYTAGFIPTVQTTYSYRIFGTIDNSPVDLTFTCAAGEVSESAEDNSEVKLSVAVTRLRKVGAFGCPSARKIAGFPEPALSAYDLNQNAQSVAAATAAVGRRAAISQTLSIGALIVGISALILAGLVWKRR